MKQGLSEIIFILDMTGSMKPLAAETVIGFNNFIEEQKKVPGEAKVTLVTFNSNSTEKVYDRVDLKAIQSMLQDQYKPDGMTPLLDTMGNTIREVDDRLKNAPEDGKPEKVIVVVMTDGEENFSRHYGRKQIFDMVTTQKDAHKWEFVFLGANQDSYLEAGRLGIDGKDASNYNATAKGMRAAYASAGRSVTGYRS